MSAFPSQERDRAQALRLRRYSMGLSASAAVALLGGLETVLGLLPPTRLLVFVLSLGAVVLTFYLLIASGLNLDL